MELCWLTCVSSALNGEELTRCGGVAILGQLLTRTVSVLPSDALPTQVCKNQQRCMQVHWHRTWPAVLQTAPYGVAILVDTIICRCCLG